ncbi:penicillin-binding protein activator LpoB [Orbus sasakiae]|uniref:Penicillin-binding protein activator LpoB n=1 Tax=Orbus sasakiae TaxID=1078475 RepID=A0ABP9N362_9GAMM
MKHYLSVVAIIISTMALSGCHLLEQNRQTPAPIQNNPVSVVEQPPKILATDWQVVISPLIAELIQTAEVSDSNSLLISDIRNRSNEYVSGAQINSIIFNAFNQQNIFAIIDKKVVNQAKQNLGIPYDDSLVSRSKMIALARQVKADYVLFTTINQVPKLPETPANVSMELLLTKTGEIVWQFSSDQLVNNNQQQTSE